LICKGAVRQNPDCRDFAGKFSGIIWMRGWPERNKAAGLMAASSLKSLYSHYSELMGIIM
jgi:hypothetical protein